MNLSSKPTEYPKQFRRCVCGATLICEPVPNTALPCDACKVGEMLVSPVTVNDIIAERAARADALDRLAVKCETNADANGNVSATGCAQHMRSLADWMRKG